MDNKEDEPERFASLQNIWSRQHEPRYPRCEEIDAQYHNIRAATSSCLVWTGIFAFSREPDRSPPSPRGQVESVKAHMDSRAHPCVRVNGKVSHTVVGRGVSEEA